MSLASRVCGASRSPAARSPNTTREAPPIPSRMRVAGGLAVVREAHERPCRTSAGADPIVAGVSRDAPAGE
jgi:hypothetical protein